MREIKFRAWDKETNLMIYDVQDAYDGLSSDNNSFELNEEYAHVCCFNSFIDSENFVLMQCTGLKDKNGIDIYECSELDGAYEVIFKYLKYGLRHISNNDVIDLYDYWRGKNGEVEVTREYTKV